jgi:hypothetical protein
MEKLYRTTDWESFSSQDPRYLLVQGRKVPYAVLENEDDVTTPQDERLGERLQKTLDTLWPRYKTV